MNIFKRFKTKQNFKHNDDLHVDDVNAYEIQKALNWKSGDRVMFVKIDKYKEFYFDELLANGIDRDLALAAAGEWFANSFLPPMLTEFSHQLYLDKNQPDTDNLRVSQIVGDFFADADIKGFDFGVSKWQRYDRILVEMYLYNQEHDEEVTLCDCLKAYLMYHKRQGNLQVILDRVYCSSDLTDEGKQKLYNRAMAVVCEQAQKVWADYHDLMVWCARHDYYQNYTHDTCNSDTTEMYTRYMDYSVRPLVNAWKRLDTVDKIQDKSNYKKIAEQYDELEHYSYDPAGDTDYFCSTKSAWK